MASKEPRYSSWQDVERHNSRWFSAANMRAHTTRILDAYITPRLDGAQYYFITSERFPEVGKPRRYYTVRMAVLIPSTTRSGWFEGHIRNLGELGQHKTPAAAARALQRYAAAGGVSSPEPRKETTHDSETPR